MFFLFYRSAFDPTRVTLRDAAVVLAGRGGALVYSQSLGRQTMNKIINWTKRTTESKRMWVCLFFFTIAYCDVWHDMSNDFRNCCLWDKTSFGCYLYDMHIMRLWRGMHWCFVLWATTICISAILQTCSSLYNAPHWNTLYTSCSSCSAVIKLAVLRALATWWMTHVVFAWF